MGATGEALQVAGKKAEDAWLVPKVNTNAHPPPLMHLLE